MNDKWQEIITDKYAKEYMQHLKVEKGYSDNIIHIVMIYINFCYLLRKILFLLQEKMLRNT